MLTDWKVKDVVGWNQDLLTREANWRQTYEPVFVLTPKLLAEPGEAHDDANTRSGAKDKDEV